MKLSNRDSTNPLKCLCLDYDLERKRVHRRIPYERDYISVTNDVGRKYYMELREEELVDSQVFVDKRYSELYALQHFSVIIRTCTNDKTMFT